MRLEAFFGSLNMRVPDLSPSRLMRCICRFTRRVPASRSMSDHFKYQFVSVRATTFAVSRTRPRVEGETFHRNPGLMRWSRLENA